MTWQAKLKRLLELYGSKRFVAKSIGVAETTLHRYAHDGDAPPRLSFRETTQKICDALSRFHDTVIPYEWFIDPKTDWPIPAPTTRSARFADVATAMLPERERAFATAISDDPVFADLVLRLFDVYTAARRAPEAAPSPPPPRNR